MAKSYWNVHPHTVLDTFRCAAPCDCHSDNPYNPPTYNVRTRTASSYTLAKGPLIKEITVECTSCDRSKTTNVEYMGVYENDFNPY